MITVLKIWNNSLPCLEIAFKFPGTETDRFAFFLNVCLKFERNDFGGGGGVGGEEAFLVS